MKKFLLALVFIVPLMLVGCRNNSKPVANKEQTEQISPVDSLKRLNVDLSLYGVKLNSSKDSILALHPHTIYIIQEFGNPQPCIFADTELPIALNPKARLCFLLYNDSIAEISISFSEDSALGYFNEALENEYGKESSYLGEYNWRTWEFFNQEIVIERHSEALYGGKYTICLRDKSLKQKWIANSKQNKTLTEGRKKEIQKDKESIRRLL